MLDIAATDEKLIGRKDGAVGHVIFNNPAKHNAVSLEMWEAMGNAMDEFLDDDNIRVVVLSGAGGKAFVSGADISKFESERATKEAVAAYAEVSAASYNKLFNFPKPTIARIEGYCIGGGVNVAICCDMRVCNKAARFAIPAAKLGLGYGHIGYGRLADVIGPSRAMEMFYTARQFSAQEAYDMGLVNAAVEDEALDETVDDITRRIRGERPVDDRSDQGRGARAVEGSRRAPPETGRRDGAGVLRLGRLYRRPSRLYGKAQTRVQG